VILHFDWESCRLAHERLNLDKSNPDHIGCFAEQNQQAEMQQL
jgi:hypothetical protein